MGRAGAADGGARPTRPVHVHAEAAPFKVFSRRPYAPFEPQIPVLVSRKIAPCRGPAPPSRPAPEPPVRPSLPPRCPPWPASYQPVPIPPEDSDKAKMLEFQELREQRSRERARSLGRRRIWHVPSGPGSARRPAAPVARHPGCRPRPRELPGYDGHAGGRRAAGPASGWPPSNQVSFS
jgi:hypothetical protein